MGDGTLVEFASVVDAVTCAAAIQKGMTGRNNSVTEDRQFELRIGVHLGDIIVDGEDIYGEGVNVAARLEGLAEPGGICLSGDAYRQVRGKVEVDFEDLGEREVKNLGEPLRVYRIALERLLSGAAPTTTMPLPLPDKPSIAVLPFTNMSGDPIRSISPTESPRTLSPHCPNTVPFLSARATRHSPTKAGPSM